MLFGSECLDDLELVGIRADRLPRYAEDQRRRWAWRRHAAVFTEVESGLRLTLDFLPLCST